MYIHWGKTLDTFENQYCSSLNMRQVHNQVAPFCFTYDEIFFS